MLGLNMIYLEAGSGSLNPVPSVVIEAVRTEISLPIAVGGGIRNRQQISEAFQAGANLVILGNGCESKPQLLTEACQVRDEISNSLFT
jgi:putative glycerol-1-phosphate prenyltransferase